MSIPDLDTLLYILNDRPDEPRSADWYRALGLTTKHGALEMSSLPTFGGAEPADTSGVWSYDETRLLVGDCAPYGIVPRGSCAPSPCRCDEFKP